MSSRPRATASQHSHERLMFGRYEAIRELGSGASGRVLLCRDHESGEQWALKELRSFGPDALIRFKSEFRTLSDLQHPNLVRLGELFEDDSRWAFTLEYIPGQDALTWVRGGVQNENGFDEARIHRLLAGLVLGLQVIHGLGIVHRDVKPENIRVTPQGRVVLLDFGIAARIKDERGTDGAPGTAAYVSPEQAAGAKPTPAADYYALGALLYQALTGQLPFEGGALEVLVAKQKRLPVSPSKIVPGIPETLERLCMALLSPEPELRPCGDVILEMLEPQSSELSASGPTPTRGHEVFVGREREREELWSHFEATERAGARLVLIEGESGIGKSALVSRFSSELRASRPDLLVLSSRCHAAERLLYKAFDSAVDELSRYLKRENDKGGRLSLPQDAELLTVLFPVLARVPAIARGALHTSSELRSRSPLYRAFAELLRQVSEQAHILLVIDDIQWADMASLSLLEAMLDHNPKARLLVVATVRPIALLTDGVGARLLELLGHPRVARLVVGRLDLTDSRLLARRLLGSEASPERSERLAHESGGHPLFVDELVRHAQENPATGSEPDLDAAIMARVNQLDPDCLRILMISCLAAGPLPYAVLALAGNLPHDTLRSSLAVLRARKLMRVARGDGSIFYHDRIREAVVHSGEPSLKARYHLALAQAWETQTDVEPVRVAYHFLQAGSRASAAPWLEMGAEAAQKVLAFDRAAELYTLSLAGVERTDPHRQELYRKLGFVLQHAGRREEAAKAFEGAAKRAEGPARSALLLRAAEQWLTGGFTARGLILLRQVGVFVPKSNLLALLRAAYSFAVLSLVRDLRVLPAAAVEDERTARVDAYWTLGTGLSLIEPLQSVDFGVRGARLSLALGDSLRIARSLCGAGFAASALGFEGLADRLNAFAARAASHQATPLARFYARAGCFLKAFLIDHDWATCIALRAELDELWRQAGLGRSFETDVADLVATWALSNQGDLRALRRRYDELTALGKRGANPFLEIALRVYHSVLFLAADDPDGAEADLDDALTTWSPEGERFQLPHAWAGLSRGEIFLYRNVPERRSELAKELQLLRSSMLDRITWLGIRRDHLHARLALAEAVKTNGVTRKRALRDARSWLKKLKSHAMPASDAFAELLAGGIFHLEGRDDQACAELERAQASFEALGMNMYERAACCRLQNLKRGVHPHEARAWFKRNGVVNADAMLRVLAPGFL